jgi:hypothetical protein
MVVLDTPDKIAMARLLTLRAGLKLEIKGMTKTPPSCYTVVKREFGFVGGKQRVLDQLSEHIFKLQQKELDLGNDQS